ncbi:flavodoxin family protein [Clostridium sp. P21]|uniref:Flavodoxin family protein n=1 Tax=Clostridium muellerianum TaxID=2716538 RepID=A0A7Y0EFY6_9CLOT|nr:flavodoxin family protein [Clostridium muellerianum]NMM62764.1 flavodoxin family protein [Clostridium muellerianum]
MRTLVFIASPHKNGNTAILLKHFLEGVSGEIEIINVYNINVKPCTDCKYCYNHKECVLKDDMTDIYKKIESSDNIVIASPVYFSFVPAPLKVVIDRLQVNWSGKFIRRDFSQNLNKKVGILIMTAGSNTKNVFEPIEYALKQFFSVTGSEFSYKIYAVNTDNVPIEKNEEIKKKAFEIGKNISFQMNKPAE